MEKKFTFLSCLFESKLFWGFMLLWAGFAVYLKVWQNDNETAVIMTGTQILVLIAYTIGSYSYWKKTKDRV